jgi:hypothetical protein
VARGRTAREDGGGWATVRASVVGGVGSGDTCGQALFACVCGYGRAYLARARAA